LWNYRGYGESQGSPNFDVKLIDISDIIDIVDIIEIILLT